MPFTHIELMDACMKPGLVEGLEANVEMVVSAADAIHLGVGLSDGGVVVFSTPAMINLMEYAARAVLAPFLLPGEESVGVSVQVEHLAPSPIGTRVTARARVISLQGRKIDFTITAVEAGREIGRGRHQRAIVTLAGLRKHMVGETLREDVVPSAMPRLALATLSVVAPRIAHLRLNRPARLNALDDALTNDLEAAVDWLSRNARDWSAVVLSGEGRAFCAGEDIHESADLDAPAQLPLTRRRAGLMAAVRALPPVTIAAVNGSALGGGCILAASCDFRIASTSARFGLPEVRLGWPPAYGWRTMIDAVGLGQALSLVLTGESFSAHRAREIGFVREVVPDARLLRAAMELAETIAQLPAAALLAAKAGLREASASNEGWADIKALEAFARCRASPEAHERMAAFTKQPKTN